MMFEDFISSADQVFSFEKTLKQQQSSFPTENRGKKVPVQHLLGIAGPFAINTSGAKTNT